MRRTLQRPVDQYGIAGHYPDCVPGVLCHCPVGPPEPVPRRVRRIHPGGVLGPWRTYGEHDPGDEDRP